ncbi:MAG TPA: TonB-dependent receptor, partial [Hyphomicrobiales bacterium]|nr:TonB-dependent receptor [Hyphomicrobiales bacterium]
LLLCISLASGTVLAQSASIEEVITLGTRVQGRFATDSAAPIDLISADDLLHYGETDVNNLLRSQVPSYNVNTHPISDAATIIRPANLRALPPDNTLVLVNGKRRHRGAVIVFLGGGLSDGSQGVDISAIPAIALKRVEVLRDGASALYGSDAIAGVINFELKDAAEGGTVEVKTATTAEGDGDQYIVAGNLGLPFGERGFVNLSLEWRDQNPTVRSVQRTDAAALAAAGNPFIPDPAEIWGQPDIDDDIKAFVNGGLDLGDVHHLYAFASYNSRRSDSSFYYRNPDVRPGVFALEVPRDSGATGYDRLVADTTMNGSGNCPVAGSANGLDINDAAGFAAVMANPDCFVFNALFPGGFTPRFRGALEDYSAALGLRGLLPGGIDYDISSNGGRNRVDFVLYNTVNASLGPESPTRFEPGSYIQDEINVTADFGLQLDLAARPLHLGSGAEWREERFEVLMGDEPSWQAGPYVAQGFSIGANGLPGFGPEVAGRFSRDNVALYFDAEWELRDDLRLGTAVRWEDFSDFGTTTNYKLSAFYRLTDNLALRATTSTGFRAPTPGQANITNVTAAYEGGVFINRGTIPATNPIAQLKGGKQLQPEESTNHTLGLLLNAAEWELALDYFHIKLDDRITLSASNELTDAERAQLSADGITGADSLTSFLFYINDFATRTQGLDFSANRSIGSATHLQLNLNWTRTEVSRHNPATLDATRIRMIEENVPELRGNATLTHGRDHWQSLLRLNYYGAFWEAHMGDGTMPTSASAEWTVDAELSYLATPALTFALGAENLFNNYPDQNRWWFRTGSLYPASAPMGINGALYYLRANYAF